MRQIDSEIKILHFQLLPLLTGVQNVMLHLIRGLESEQFTFSVVSAPQGALVEKLNEMRIKHYPISGLIQKIIPYDIVIWWKFYRICRLGKFDIVHTHSSKTGFLGRIAARLAGVPIVIHTIHGFSFNPFQSLAKRYFFMFLEWLGAIFCQRAISVNESERHLAIKKKIISKSKIITIYNGIEEVKVTASISRDELGFDDHDIIFGSASRFSEQKNIIKLIRIAIRIVRNYDFIKFVFVGDGELFPIAQRMIREAGVSHSIKLPGWQSNIPDWNELVDVYILYSLWEGLSLSVIEALALGKPVILSNIKGNDELVDDGINGFLVDVNNRSKVEEKIIFMAKNPKTLPKMGKASEIKFKKMFTLKRFLENYRKLYTDLILEKL